ncbi:MULTISPECIES: family 43 glycosylhydrolase [Sphingomonas]|uniref:family 43 glycosylhydrolase n=1 Tax=Sphingomonas TaxID=13687 RepID=UPI000F7F117A|nr:family 43 glycosylhydrolase [Sphingomonas sp. ABOLF]RSV15108.1 glycosyl hydrolase family 43 [Sphingomonas sp. ABOLF]GLK19825.1 glycosyl hydrolase family 43 [Microbacterium terregens]
MRAARPVAVAALLPAVWPAAAQQGVPVQSAGNPILADGRFYSTDPAPVVIDDALYILAGRDEAPPDVNDFIMNEWQLLATREPAAGAWTHYPAVATPEGIFRWAEPGRAYAGQIVKGPDGRLYLYAPVLEANTDAKDGFAIGVAVADSPTGPWVDAHPAGPIVSQRVPEPNTIQNIDPTVLVDDDGRVYLYWGTFGKLRGIELERDMVTPKGRQIAVTGLTGFFEAPWLMKRKDVYYLLYAGNNAGPDSPCTPTLYHACIAYGTAPTPLGPWTYRGTVLKPVSSTTSHPGTVEYRGQWYLAYHTADGAGGGHFRRSVAIDRLEWDDSVSPAAIRPVVPTRSPRPVPPPSRNIAPAATPAASNEPIPVRFWLRALNDGATRASPLPPEMWGSATAANPPQQWIEYRWPQPVTVSESRIWFVAEEAAGVAPPASWRIEYWDGSWKPVPRAGRYNTAAGAFQQTRFAPVRTRCLRAIFQAARVNGTNAGMAVQEWEVLTRRPTRVTLPPEPALPCEPRE